MYIDDKGYSINSLKQLFANDVRLLIDEPLHSVENTKIQSLKSTSILDL